MSYSEWQLFRKSPQEYFSKLLWNCKWNHTEKKAKSSCKLEKIWININVKHLWNSGWLTALLFLSTRGTRTCKTLNFLSHLVWERSCSGGHFSIHAKLHFLHHQYELILSSFRIYTVYYLSIQWHVILYPNEILLMIFSYALSPFHKSTIITLFKSIFKISHNPEILWCITNWYWWTFSWGKRKMKWRIVLKVKYFLDVSVPHHG